MNVTEWKKKISEARKSAVLFIGIQASGKSAFYAENFADTHVRINLDELHTRRKERLLLEECIAVGKSFAVDNTNPKAEDRARYIEPAKAAGYFITGILFDSSVKECAARNALREGKAKVPDIAIAATANKLEMPVLSEGFDELYYVSIESGGFKVNERNEAGS